MGWTSKGIVPAGTMTEFEIAPSKEFVCSVMNFVFFFTFSPKRSTWRALFKTCDSKKSVLKLDAVKRLLNSFAAIFKTGAAKRSAACKISGIFNKRKTVFHCKFHNNISPRIFLF